MVSDLCHYSLGAVTTVLSSPHLRRLCDRTSQGGGTGGDGGGAPAAHSSSLRLWALNGKNRPQWSLSPHPKSSHLLVSKGSICQSLALALVSRLSRERRVRETEDRGMYSSTAALGHCATSVPVFLGGNTATDPELLLLAGGGNNFDG